MLLFQNIFLFIDTAKTAAQLHPFDPTGLGAVLLAAIAVSLFGLIAQCVLFEKVGRKWWEALIPFYNSWVLAKFILKKPDSWTTLHIILPLIPFLNVLWSLYAAFAIPAELCEMFGYSRNWGLVSGFSTIFGTGIFFFFFLIAVGTALSPFSIPLLLSCGLLFLLLANLPIGMIAFGNRQFSDPKLLLDLKH
ncbi:MAG: hypothetical protein RI894_2189 [Bacteroidota bacterium]|jgi:hypothetical protein